MKDELEYLQVSHEKSMLNYQLEIQEQTFRNISEEIHDNISLTLSLAKLHLNKLLEAAPSEQEAAFRTPVDLVSKSLIDLNDLSKTLNADFIVQNGFLQALEYEADLISRTGKIHVDFTVTGQSRSLGIKRELLAFRIIQEAFNNVIRHAEADRIRLTLDYAEEEMRFSIRDNGRGFDPEKVRQKKDLRGGAGMKNIENRVKMLSASWCIESIQQEGTAIHVQIPYSVQHEAKSDEYQGSAGR